jgi:hypothetical protein
MSSLIIASMARVAVVVFRSRTAHGTYRNAVVVANVQAFILAVRRSRANRN